MIARLTASYLAVFAAVLAVISGVAYWLVGAQYTSLLAPALNTPEGMAGYRAAMRHVALAIGGADIPLLILVGVLAYVLARASLQPLMEAREREVQFAADAAHELRSPLATIATVAQAARGQAEGVDRQAFDTIAATALDASGLIGDLLTLSRAPRSGLLQSEPVDVEHVAAACAQEFLLRVGERQITFDVRASGGIIEGDERRLRELLRNLLDNALKHTSTTIALESGTDGRYAYLRVSDNGPGIPPELRRRIFKRFFQANPSGPHTAGNGNASVGNGLGLALAHWIAHAHDGSLEVVDTEKGATFVARFPRIR